MIVPGSELSTGSDFWSDPIRIPGVCGSVNGYGIENGKCRFGCWIENAESGLDP